MKLADFRNPGSTSVRHDTSTSVMAHAGFILPLLGEHNETAVRFIWTHNVRHGFNSKIG
jgi:hypothetical protein